MSVPRSARLYQRMLRLYPRDFRDEYGTDMVGLFVDQLRDEAAIRVWLRAAVDLAITAPARHLETRMNRPSPSSVPILFAILSLAGVLVAVVGGTNLAMFAISMSVAVAFGVLAVVAWLRTRPTAVTVSRATAQWWRFLLGGAITLGGLIAVTTITGELNSSGWLIAMIVLLGALTSLSAGVVLGLARLAGYRLRNVRS